MRDDLTDRAMRDRAFAVAVSLIAALEGIASPGCALVLPCLGIARAELVDYGQRRIPRFVRFHVADRDTGLADLDGRLDALLGDSEDLQHTACGSRRHAAGCVARSKPGGDPG
ncbi:hypothetical protein KUV85_00405 [Nocardioides panacisoli]|uniref:hypothetical protein n=1 Tax=Nocardioides panacisoli TaxID=627624 RepID=UPI001C62BCAD|nr:hypothetical protein [Nocardioides panacisoli]QYJ04176.1 hypothetical protein KUV85_00405 [Nocardioides panacisoli]